MNLLLIAFLLTPMVVNPFANSKKYVLRDLKASVLLHTKTVGVDKNGITQRRFSGCSGTFVGPYTILTAAHCFETPTTQVWARGPYESVGYPVHLVAWDRKKDLALLDVPFKHPYVKIGKLPRRGDHVLNIGSPMNFEFVPSEGLIGEVEYAAKGFTARYLITTAMCNPGSSGGGAFNEKGELIGVNTMIVGIFGWMGITMTVNTDTIHLFLSEALKYYHHEAYDEI